MPYSPVRYSQTKPLSEIREQLIGRKFTDDESWSELFERLQVVITQIRNKLDFDTQNNLIIQGIYSPTDHVGFKNLKIYFCIDTHEILNLLIEDTSPGKIKVSLPFRGQRLFRGVWVDDDSEKNDSFYIPFNLTGFNTFREASDWLKENPSYYNPRWLNFLNKMDEGGKA